MPALYTIRRTSGDRFYFSLTSDNNEVILTSENYTSKAAADIGIHAVRANATNQGAYSRRVAEDGKCYFVLLAANGDPLATSQQYPSTDAMESGIASVLRNGLLAPVQDLS